MKILVFDTETAGKALRWSPAEVDRDAWPALLQLSAKLIEVDLDNVFKPFKIIYDFNSYVLPFRGEQAVEIHPDAQKVHNITFDHCVENGNDIATVSLLFQGLLNTADILVAHNFFFDRNVMTAEMLKANIPPKAKGGSRTFCTMQYNTDVLKLPNPKKPGTNKYPSLSETYKHYFNQNMSEVFNAHDSNEDVGATLSIFVKMLQVDEKLVEKLKSNEKKLY